MLTNSEEKALDKFVISNTRRNRDKVVPNFIYRIFLFTLVFIAIGLGVFFMPEKNQRMIVQPVSAQEILNQTLNKLNELIKRDGILHYKYISVLEQPMLPGNYDTFEVDKYVSTNKPQYKIIYTKSRKLSESVIHRQNDGTDLIQEFPVQNITIYSDGINEYYNSTYTEKTYKSEDLISIEHKNMLEELAKFYEFLINNNADDYLLKEEIVEGKPAYVITFDYEGLLMKPNSGSNNFSLLEMPYTSEIIIDKETGFPLLHKSTIQNSDFVDTQYEKFQIVELLPLTDAPIIFNENEILVNLREAENNVDYSISPVSISINGKVTQKYIGEDIIDLKIIGGDVEYGLLGSNLYDGEMRKIGLIGRFLTGKDVWIQGRVLDFKGFGKSIFVDSIDFEQFAKKPVVVSIVNPTLVSTIMPTTSTTPNPNTVLDKVKIEMYEMITYYHITRESNSILELLNDNGIETIVVMGTNYNLSMTPIYENENYDGLKLPNDYVVINTINIGKIYRVPTKNNMEYAYISQDNFRTSGSCHGPYWEATPVPAPCGSYVLSTRLSSSRSSVLDVLCTASNMEGLKSCDSIIKNLKISL